MTLPVHLEVDTGMGRGGMLYTEALESIRAIRSLPHLEIEGVFSHMASSEVRDEPYNATQWNAFPGSWPTWNGRDRPFLSAISPTAAAFSTFPDTVSTWSGRAS